MSSAPSATRTTPAINVEASAHTGTNGEDGASQGIGTSGTQGMSAAKNGAERVATPVPPSLLPAPAPVATITSTPSAPALAVATNGDTAPSPSPALPSSTPTPHPGSTAGNGSATGSTAFPGQVNAVAGPSSRPEIDVLAWEQAGRKRKWEAKGYGQVEMGEMERRATELHLTLAMDQQSTLFPPPPTAFASYGDVVDRLLPYHIWQIHDEELESSGGEERERERQRKETQDAAELVHRIIRAQNRFAKVRRRSGHHPSDIPTYLRELLDSTQDTRSELTGLQTQLQNVRGGLAYYTNKEKARADEARRKEERKRAEEERRRMEEERRRAEVERKRAEEARRSASVSAPPGAARTDSAVDGPVTVGRPATSTPARAALIASPTPATPSTASPGGFERGRPRGRPRGRGRGGLREAVLTHTPAARAAQTASPTPKKAEASTTPPPTSSAAKPLASAPARTGGAAAPAQSGTSGGASQPPVSITVALSMIPNFVQLGILSLPNPSPATNATNSTPAKAPGTILRTTEDRKSAVLSINLAACSKSQVQSIAKLLNITLNPNQNPKGGSPNEAGKQEQGLASTTTPTSTSGPGKS